MRPVFTSVQFDASTTYIIEDMLDRGGAPDHVIAMQPWNKMGKRLRQHIADISEGMSGYQPKFR